MNKNKRMLLNILIVVLVFAASWASMKRNPEAEAETTPNEHTAVEEIQTEKPEENREQKNDEEKNKNETMEAEQNNTEEKTELPIHLEDLQNTENFAKGSLGHIFHGDINRKGKATGYHSESMEDTPGKIIVGSAKSPDNDGVYVAQVEVNGVKKASNKGYSTFFPKEWNPQEVVDGINEAYDSRQHDNGNTYLGETQEGIIVQMYLNDKNKIISAFPIQ